MELPTAQDALHSMSTITADAQDEMQHQYDVGRRNKGKEKVPRKPKLSPPPREKPSAFDTTTAARAVHTATQRAMKKQVAVDNSNDAELKEKVELVRKIKEYQQRFPTYVGDRTPPKVTSSLESLRGQLYSCRTDVSSRAAEQQIKGFILQVPALMEAGTQFVNPLDWDLSGFGEAASSEEFRAELETELSEAVIEMRGKFIVPWYLRLMGKFIEMGNRYSSMRKNAAKMQAAAHAQASASALSAAAEARRSAQEARESASKGKKK